MSKRAAKKPQSNVQWIDFTLTKDQAASMKERYAQGSKVEDDSVQLVDDGYKFTISADSYNNCYACFVIQKGEGGVNEGKILTARGNSWWNALRGALYRHYIIFDGDSWTNHEQQSIDSD